MEKINDNLEDLTENTTPIQYLLIGDISTNKIITEYSSTINSAQIKKEINQIFAKSCKNQSKKYNERYKITSKDTIYYYTLVKPNFIFIILVEDEYSEELVFELIDKIIEEKIITMINEETQELNPNGRVEVKNIIRNLVNRFQTPSLGYQVETKTRNSRIGIIPNKPEEDPELEKRRVKSHKTRSIRKDGRNYVQRARLHAQFSGARGGG